MLEQFKSLGISYKETNVDNRSTVSLSENEINNFLIELKNSWNISEAIIISTCNRTEIFYSSKEEKSKELYSLLFNIKGLQAPSQLLDKFISLDGIDAVDRLFNISIGLESKVLGDLQIINQIKKSYQASADLDMAGPFLHRLLHGIFFTNKRVVQETAFRDGAASVSYASYELINELASSLIEPKILLIGLGEMGKDIALHLNDHDYANVTLLNRNNVKAIELSKKIGFKHEDSNNLKEAISDHDIIVSAVNATNPIIQSSIISEDLAFKYFLDISMPRSISPEVGNISGVMLYTIDDIENKTNKALEKRRKAISQVQDIVAEGINEFKNWSTELELSPTIQGLKTALEGIRKEEISKYLNKMDDKQVEMVELVTKSMMQKIIKLPVLELKAACKRGEAENLIDALNGIFNLENQSQKA